MKKIEFRVFENLSWTNSEISVANFHLFEIHLADLW